MLIQIILVPAAAPTMINHRRERGCNNTSGYLKFKASTSGEIGRGRRCKAKEYRAAQVTLHQMTSAWLYQAGETPNELF